MIAKKGPDWCLVDGEKRGRLFATLAEAKAGAEWNLGLPQAD